jgi:hypothetical protein
VLRQITDTSPGLHGLFGHIEPTYRYAALTLRQVSGDDFHRGRFSGAVRPQKTEHLAFACFKRDAVHRALHVEYLGQVVNFDGHVFFNVVNVVNVVIRVIRVIRVIAGRKSR